MSKLLPPEPGHGYKPRDWRGRGAWKEVYRAVSQRAGEWRDVALLRYLKQPEMKDVLKEIQFAYDMMIKPPIPEHVARLYHFFMGDDGHVYLVQELMYRPLDKLAPLSAAERYLRIARDLSTGLRELHERTLVHRDLKLDNCGVDYNDRAKLFDLGLVTSEDAPNLGTLLTLAPELCVDSARPFSKEADIWALGATLFALRSGEYPFVTPTELARRRDLNADSPADQEERQRMNDQIRQLRTAGDAEGRLQSQVHSLFPTLVADLLCRMLSYEPSARPTAEIAAEEWADCIRKWLEPAEVRPPSGVDATYMAMTAQLNAVLKQGAHLSHRQWQRACDISEHLREMLDEGRRTELASLLDRVSELRAAGQLP